MSAPDRPADPGSVDPSVAAAATGASVGASEVPPAPVDDPEDSTGATVMAPPEWQRTGRPTAKARPAPATRSPRVDHNVGLVLGGQYRLERAVGQGGTGRVYVATQLSLGRAVAVKMLRADLESDSAGEQFAERFFREASLAGSLSHPNVVTVHDYGQDEDGTCFIVMELVEGRSLKELMKAGPMEPERALDLFAQLARGLRHAHRAGLVHRDVKPGNVQITPGDDGREVAKLLDFGLVKSELPEVTEITREGSFLGTPHYASPEQVRGQEADARSDLYALGVMLYRALCGVLPYYSRNSMALAMAHVRDPYPPMSERAPDITVDPSHEAIVRRLMHKDASRRYPDADSLLVELEVALARLRDGGATASVAVVPPPVELETESDVVVGSEPSHDSGASAAAAPQAAPPASSPKGPIFAVAAVLAVSAMGFLGAHFWIEASRAPPEPPVIEAAASLEPVGEVVPVADKDSGDWSAEVLGGGTPVALQVSLGSQPGGADVRVDGTVVGQTPWVGSLAVDDGVHQSVELVLDGYAPHTVVLPVDGGTASEVVVLQSLAPPRRAAPSPPPRTRRSEPTPAPPAAPPEQAEPPPAPTPAPSRRAGTRPVTVDGVPFDPQQAEKTVQFANSATVDAFKAAGIRVQEFNRVKAGRPYSSIQAVGAAPGVGPKTVQRMRDAAQ